MGPDDKVRKKIFRKNNHVMARHLTDIVTYRLNRPIGMIQQKVHAMAQHLMNIATYRLNRPRGRISEKQTIKKTNNIVAVPTTNYLVIF